MNCDDVISIDFYSTIIIKQASFNELRSWQISPVMNDTGVERYGNKMSKVNCNVSNCSYNKEKTCTADCIKIGGQSAETHESTCCGSFLNSSTYSNFADYSSMRSGDQVDILCNVMTCKYYGDGQCSLDEIDVGGTSRAQIYTETDCASFDKES